MRAVLIGFGSIGRRHASCMAGRFFPFVIVDVDPEAQKVAKVEYPEAIVLPELSDLWQLNWDWQQVLVVIATWGPSHHHIFFECVDRGVRLVVCEKPLATSVRCGRQIITEAQDRCVTLGVNHVQRFLGVDAGLRLLAERHALGEPQSVVVHGGASGLVTNGIHFIDLAISMFGGIPRSVLSTAKGEAMNPRSPSLMFYGGTAIWAFDGGREAVITFSNQSSVFPTFTIYYRDAVLHLYHHQHVEVVHRHRAALDTDSPVTRTGRATEMIYSGRVPGSLDTMEDAFHRLYDEVISGNLTTFHPEMAYEALQACIGALVSAHRGCQVKLPLDADSAVGRETFPIS